MAWAKLISDAGTLLGTITFPEGISDILAANECAVFAIMEPVPVSPLDAPVSLHATLSHVRLCWARNWPVRDGLHLDGISIERFEQIPGCSFAPGAAYLRSLFVQS